MRYALLVLMMAAWVSPASAQWSTVNLADLARTEAQRRAALTTPGRVITNADLPIMRPVSVPPFAPARTLLDIYGWPMPSTSLPSYVSPFSESMADFRERNLPKPPTLLLYADPWGYRPYGFHRPYGSRLSRRHR